MTEWYCAIEQHYLLLFPHLSFNSARDARISLQKEGDKTKDIQYRGYGSVNPPICDVIIVRAHVSYQTVL